MATIIKKQYPIDSDNRKIVGFKLPMSGDAVFNPTYTTQDQTKANIINYLLTNKGERPFNPTFGANLRALLFEVINEKTQDGLIERIQSDLQNFFPDVEILDISFDNQIDENAVYFTLDYRIKAFEIKDSINIVLQ